MGKVFWIGIIGGIFGILGAVLAILIQSISEAFNATSGTNLYYNAAAAIMFSIVGIAGGVLGKILGATLMIIGALGVVISISAFGILTFILFSAGGILILHYTDCAYHVWSKRILGSSTVGTYTVSTPLTGLGSQA